MRQNLDDARAKARMRRLAVFFLRPCAIVGNRELPSELLCAVTNEDVALLAAWEGMLQSVDQESVTISPRLTAALDTAVTRGRLHLPMTTLASNCRVTKSSSSTASGGVA